MEDMEIAMLPFDIYKNKRILVTGHTGFKGSWLSIWLNELNADVVGFSLAAWNNDYLFKKAELNKHVVDERGNVADLARLEEVFRKYKPECVFHLAAQPLVRDSYVNPTETFNTNITGTINVLECIRKFDCITSGVIITTDKCYKNREQKKGYKETDELGGYDPYSTSKAAAELIIDSYRKSFFSDCAKLVASARAGNNIGGGDFSKDRILPDCIAALQDNRPIRIRNPKSTRPWQHALEPLYGYLLLGSKLLHRDKNFAEGWNFGPEKESMIPVATVVDTVIKRWGSGRWVDIHNPHDLHESRWLSLDISKAKKKLKWKPRWGIGKAIQKTVEWYKSVDTQDAYRLCAQQIREYIDEK